MARDKGGIFGLGILRDRREKEHYPECRKHDSSARSCDWESMRILNLRNNPRCGPPKWKVIVSKDSPMRPGETLYLCDYHKKNLALKFDKVERL